MASELDALLGILRQGSQAGQTLPGMNTELAEAKALRAQPIAPIDQQTGFMSPFAALAGMIDKGRGAQQQRELKPRIAQAQQQVAGAKSGLQEYGLRQAVEKERVRVAEAKAKEGVRVGEKTTAEGVRVAEAVAKEQTRIKEEKIKAALLAKVNADKAAAINRNREDTQTHAVTMQDTRLGSVEALANKKQELLDKKLTNQREVWNKEDKTINKFIANDSSGRPVDVNTGERVDMDTWTSKGPTKKGGGAGGYYREIGTAKQQEEFESQANETQNQITLFRQFQPEFGASGYVPRLGTLKNLIAKEMPGVASPEMLKKERFWRDFAGQYTNLKRHDLFGSALTDGEQAAWRKANVDENSSAEQIEDSMFTLDYLARKLAWKTRNNALIKGRNEEYVDSNYGYMEQYGDFQDLSEIPTNVERGEWEDLTYKERSEMYEEGVVQ